MSQLVVNFKANPVNGWFLRAFARPYAAIDGNVVQCSWSGGTPIEITPGTHQLRTFIRYRGVIPGDLGSGTLSFDVGAATRIHVESRNGAMNNTPFTPRIMS